MLHQIQKKKLNLTLSSCSDVALTLIIRNPCAICYQIYAKNALATIIQPTIQNWKIYVHIFNDFSLGKQFTTATINDSCEKLLHYRRGALLLLLDDDARWKKNQSVHYPAESCTAICHHPPIIID